MRDKPHYDERMQALEHRAATLAYKTTVALLYAAALVFMILEDYRAALVCLSISVVGSIPYLLVLNRGGHGAWWREEINATSERKRRALVRLALGTVGGGSVYFSMWYWVFRETLATSIIQTAVWVVLWSSVNSWLMFRLRRKREPDEDER